jgi:hypothetical protein
MTKPNVTITWNENVIEEFKQKAYEHAFKQMPTCPKCGTSPELRQFGRYYCECGYLQGVVNEKG